MEQPPHALILGWAGSKEQHFRSIIKWYSSEGYTTRLFTANAFSYLFHPRGIKRHAAPLAEEVARDLGNPPRNFVVHLFSNNGFATLAALLSIFRQGGERDHITSRLRSIIIDSAPSFTSKLTARQGADSYARGIMAMTAPGSPFSTKPVYDLARLSLATAFWSYFTLRRNAIPTMRQFAETVISAQVPSLVLAGRFDIAVPLERIETFVEESRSRGNHVKLHVFDTEHVQMSFRFRDDYYSKVSTFLQSQSNFSK